MESLEKKKKQSECMRKWRENNREKHRQATKDYELRMRKPCPECGQLMKRTSSFCAKCSNGERHHSWKGENVRHIDRAGYVCVKARSNENGAKRNGYILEHRRVMQDHLGRSLFPNENVHHKNGVRSDNRIENLELWITYHPSGLRPEDLLEWADTIISRYRKKEGW
jgi:hypothetical protein